MEENGARIPRLGLPFVQQLMALPSIRTYFKTVERTLSTSMLTFCLNQDRVLCYGKLFQLTKDAN
jgi:hypothetical protein